MSTAKGPALNPSTGKFRKRHIGLIVYFVFLLLPIYWLIAMSVRPNQEILSGFDLFPRTITFAGSVVPLSWRICSRRSSARMRSISRRWLNGFLM